jgi:hypothetical protein
MASASAVMASKFPGKNARQRGLEKRRLALTWVYRWGWASPSTVEIVGGAKRSGLAARLVRNGLLEETKTACGGGHLGVPVKILTLSVAGVQEVERTRERLRAYPVGGNRVRMDEIRKFQLAQRATLTALELGDIQACLVGLETAALIGEGVKLPTMLWSMADSTKVGIEVELSSRWGRDLDVFIDKCVTALSPNNGRARPFDQIAVLSDSSSIIKRYKAAFAKGAQYQLWEKDPRGYWQAVDTKTVSEFVAAQMRWHLTKVE